MKSPNTKKLSLAQDNHQLTAKLSPLPNPLRQGEGVDQKQAVKKGALAPFRLKLNQLKQIYVQVRAWRLVSLQLSLLAW